MSVVMYVAAPDARSGGKVQGGGMRLRLVLIASFILALAAPPGATAAGSSSASASASASSASSASTAAKKRKCRPGYVAKKVRRGKGRKARRVRRCVRRRAPVSKQQPAPAPAPAPSPAAPGPAPPPEPVNHVEPVRDDARFAEALANSYFYRTYSPGNDATHEEKYDFCPTALHHYYEGIAYIYQARGPWTVIEGSINTAGDKAKGIIEYTQQTANFDEEVGKVQRIEIAWSANPLVPQWSVARISHPEIGSYEFDRSSDASGTCG